MPDVHAGAGCTIGTTMTIQDKAVPNLVGVDIGCGMETIRIKNDCLDLEQLDKLIRAKIPSGCEVRKKPQLYNEKVRLSDLCCKAELNLVRASLSIGTLGGGNHFIEADSDSDGHIYIVVHSGSRHLGLEVADYYQKAGYKQLNKNTNLDLEHLIQRYKEQGRQNEINAALKASKHQVLTQIPKTLAYVSGDLFLEYIHDMKIVQRFAELNRKAMINERICKA